MIRKIIAEFLEKPIGSVGALVAIIGFTYSLISGSEIPPIPTQKIYSAKYIAIIVSMGIGIFFALLSSSFYKANKFVGFVIASFLSFLMGSVVYDLLSNFGFDPGAAVTLLFEKKAALDEIIKSKLVVEFSCIMVALFFYVTYYFDGVTSDKTKSDGSDYLFSAIISVPFLVFIFFWPYFLGLSLR